MTIEPISVRFYVHADTPVPERRQRVTRLLTELSTKGTIDSYSMEFWPKAVSLDAMGATTNGVLQTYEEIQLWAERAGASVTPPFSIVADRWEATGETDTRLHTPNMCILVERGDELVGVFPHERDDEVWTLEEGLSVLETESGVEIELDDASEHEAKIEARLEALTPEQTEDITDPQIDPIER